MKASLPRSKLQPYRKLAMAAAAALLVAVAVVTVLGARTVDKDAKWVAHTYDALRLVDQTEYALQRAESASRVFRLTGLPAQETEFLDAAALATRSLARLAELTRDNPVQQRRALALRDATQAQIREMQQVVEASGRNGSAHNPTLVVASMQRMQRTARLLEAMRDEEARLLARRRAAADIGGDWLLAFVVIGLVLSFAMLRTLVWNLSRENVRNRSLAQEAREAVVRMKAAQAQSDRLAEQRRALSTYTGMLQSCQNLDEAMEMTASTMQRMVPDVGGRCYVARASRDYFETAVNFGHEAATSADLLRAQDCWGLRRGQAHHTDGAPGAMRCAHLDPGASLAGIATLCVPLVAQGETLGMLHANAPRRGGEDDHDVQVLESMAEQLSMAMANLRLRDTLRVQSLRDPLTNLFNRRYLEENLQRELQRCERQGLPLSLLMIDIDHFKQFNDQHGHAAGDAVLAHVGHTLQSLVRNEDLACRYGGEEFTVVLPEADADVAVERAEEIRAAVASTTILHLRKTLGPVTMSIGIATFPHDGTTPELLFEIADVSLYRAKAEGRNRVVRAAAMH
ncbi:MAG TPA: diguanylate cyclase [Luteimonas sp.]|nr:diguanylate cyclase [Luteimonas sp.]